MQELRPSATVAFELPAPMSSRLKDLVLRPATGLDRRREVLRDPHALLHAGRVWLCTGQLIQCANVAGDLEPSIDLGQSRDLAPVLRRLRSGATEPRAVPFAGLDGQRTLWMLDGYDDAHQQSLTLPFVIERGSPARARPLEPRGRTIGLRPSEPKQVLASDDPQTFWLTGSVDAGAMVHVDEFIDIGTAYRLDLARRKLAWHDKPVQGHAVPRSSVVGAFYCQTELAGRTFTTMGQATWRRENGQRLLDVTLAGLPCRLALEDIAPERGVFDDPFTLVRGDEVVVLDMRTLERAVVVVWSARGQAT